MIKVKEYIYIFLTILETDEKEKNDEKTVDFGACCSTAAPLSFDGLQFPKKARGNNSRAKHNSAGNDSRPPTSRYTRGENNEAFHH
jgi:hypothetical protein